MNAIKRQKFVIISLFLALLLLSACSQVTQMPLVPSDSLRLDALQPQVTLEGASEPTLSTLSQGGSISVAPTDQLFGYVSLALFGISPLTGIGDETITNLDTPSFLYAGESYTRIGMVSNGYLMVGGGTDEDVSFINTHLPNPSRPNNILAPFWTDLNPGFGGELRATILTSGPNRWLVFEWENVRNYSGPQTASFQVWIGLNDEEDITIVYDSVNPGDLGFLTIGAEDKTGTIGDTYYFDGVGTLPTAGTTLRVTYNPPLQADLVLSKTASASEVVVNEPFIYTITVTNLGPEPATNVTVTDLFDPSFEIDFDALVYSWTLEPPATGLIYISINLANDFSFLLSELEVGQTLSIIVRVSPQQAGVFTNEASVTADELDPDLTNNTDSATVTVLLNIITDADLGVLHLMRVVNVQLEVFGGVAPYIWHSPDLHLMVRGLSLTADGRILGRPLQRYPGPRSFTVYVTDANGVMSVQQFTVVVR